MERPSFNSIKNYEEFCRYYWYRDELIRICKGLGLKAPSGKIELYKVIEAYFAGEKILPEKRSSKGKKKALVTELTLDTGLIDCGFTFGNRFREFFSKQTGEERFKFNVAQLPSKASPISSPSPLITGLPELPPVMSLVVMKFTIRLPFSSA